MHLRLRGLTAAAALTFPLFLHAQTAPPPPFQNPAEVVRHADGTFQAVMVMGDADRNIPSIGTKHLRYFQGWDPATPNAKAPASLANVAPGPTLRMRVGDKAEIMFLNTVDDSKFQYTFVTEGKDDNPAYGCDAATNLATYPAKDRFPNCFHGSSTANLHFHGTHTSPDGLGDNVLIQVMPDKNTSEKDWAAVFQKIFSGPIPAKWGDLPQEYRTRQEALVKAAGNGLWEWDAHQIMMGQWPQYIVGAYPNYFVLPDGSKGGYAAGQSPGTHWYHAHKHGSTSLHSLNGLAGAIVIEGAYDDYLKQYYKLGASYGNFEKIMVFQIVNPDQNLPRGSVNFAGVGPGALLINGLLNPQLTMRPGEIQLWRVVNATNGAAFTGIGAGVIGPDLFTTKGFNFRETAKDGVQLSPANYVSQPFLNAKVPFAASGPTVPASQAALPTGLVLMGGNRADVLVQAPTTPGVYTFTSNGGGVFTVNVTGVPVTMTFPDSLPALPSYLADLPPQQDYPHHVTFGWDAEPGRNQIGGQRMSSSIGLKLPPRYTIDNKQFEQFGPIIDQCVPLNSIQDWVLENNTTVSHPFHIHINPFQVIKVETPIVNKDGTGFTYLTYPGPNDPQNNYVWQDVVTIPAGVTLLNGQFIPGRATIRQHFVDFTGTFVLHCHILGHEDRGMMQLVRVVPASQYPSGCQSAIPQHH